VWIWLSAALAIAVVGLLIWGLNKQSDLDSSQQQVGELQSQAEQNQDTGSQVVAGIKAAYDDLAKQVGATQEDLASAEEDVQESEQATAEAEEDAAAAKQDASQAKSQTDKASAEADEAKAEVEAAKSKAAIAGDCAKAYVSAIGTLFEGESVKAQASAVRDQLEGISAKCKSALEGT
jgi:chromosome segregation ATPase